jgi:hypothetical protein
VHAFEAGRFDVGQIVGNGIELRSPANGRGHAYIDSICHVDVPREGFKAIPMPAKSSGSWREGERIAGIRETSECAHD